MDNGGELQVDPVKFHRSTSGAGIPRKYEIDRLHRRSCEEELVHCYQRFVDRHVKDEMPQGGLAAAGAAAEDASRIVLAETGCSDVPCEIFGGDFSRDRMAVLIGGFNINTLCLC